MENKDNKKKDKEAIKAAAPAQRFIYCGPNIPGGALRQFSVFKGGYPDFAAGIIEECPAVKELFVPAKELARARVDITITGTALNQLYREVQGYISKEGR